MKILKPPMKIQSEVYWYLISHGYHLEFVALYGPDNSGWLNEPYRHHMEEGTLVGSDGEKKDAKFGGCEVMMISR